MHDVIYQSTTRTQNSNILAKVTNCYYNLIAICRDKLSEYTARLYDMLQAFRLFFLYIHLILTLALFWTKVDIIRISTSEADYEKYSTDFDILIAVGTLCLLVKGVAYGFTYSRVSLGLAIHLLCDVIGSFFVIWIILDGWRIESYIVIFLFCGLVLSNLSWHGKRLNIIIFLRTCRLLPALFDVVSSILYMMKRYQVKIKD